MCGSRCSAAVSCSSPSVLPVAPCCSSSQLDPSTMETSFTVTLQCGATTAEITVPDMQTELRDLQKPICAAFSEHFPVKTAHVQVCDMLFDELGHIPLAAGPPGHVCIVTFETTTDMYWIDKCFRDSKEPSLEQEMNPQVQQQPVNAIPDFPTVA